MIGNSTGKWCINCHNERLLYSDGVARCSCWAPTAPTVDYDPRKPSAPEDEHDFSSKKLPEWCFKHNKPCGTEAGRDD